MTSASLDWVWQVVGGGLAVVGVGVLVWALFRDRARGRERCPGCWYDMAGWSERGSLVCPECGLDARTKRRLQKTRRRWRWVGVGMVVVVLAWAASVWPRAARDGLWSVAPTWALVVLEPEAPLVWLSDPGFFRIEQTEAMKELLRRADEGTGGDAWGWCVRRAYERRGRWGVAEADAAVLGRLRSIAPAAVAYKGTVDHVAGVVGVEASVGVQVDWANLTPVTGVDALDSFEVDRNQASLAGLLDGLMQEVDPWRAVWTVIDGQVVVLPSHAAGGYTRTVAYPIGDILAQANPDYGGDELLDIVETNIALHHWIDNGGMVGTIELSGDTLYVRQLAPAQHEIELLLAEYRAVRGLR